MPPLRTPKKAKAKAVGTLSAFGFVPVAKEEARARLERSCIKPPAPVPQPEATPAAREATVEVIDLEDEATPEKPSVPTPTQINAFETLKRSAVLGVYKASFNRESQWQERAKMDLGSSTKMISFNGDFALKPEHFDFILSLPNLCAGLEYFTFNYDDVSYNATNSAKDVTEECVVKLARACPNLREFVLQGVSMSSVYEPLIALFEHCPKLTSIDLTSHSRSNLATDNEVFIKLLNNPDWVPRLKVLRVNDNGRGNEVYQLSKARHKLHLKLITISEEKKWGDWELEISSKELKKGKEFSPRPRYDEYDSYTWRPRPSVYGRFRRFRRWY